MSRPEELEHLEAMFGLEKVGVTITGVHMFGAGSRAAVRIDLDNGEQMMFDNVREMTKPVALRSELVACTGSTAKITADQAVQAVAHVRKVAARTLAVTEDGTALDWAHSYLGAATTLDVGMSDMRERFAAFERLERNSPWDRARAEAISIAAAGIVLRDVDGTRYVRCGWFASFVRQQDPTLGRGRPHGSHGPHRVGAARDERQRQRAQCRDRRALLLELLHRAARVARCARRGRAGAKPRSRRNRNYTRA